MNNFSEKDSGKVINMKAKHVRKNKSMGSQKHPVLHTCKWALLVFIFGFVVLLASALRWGLNQWGELSIDEIVFTLLAPLKGTGIDMWASFALNCAMPTVLAVGILLIVLGVTKEGSNSRLAITLALFVLAGSAFGIFFQEAWSDFDVGTYLRSKTEKSTFIDKNYTDPATVNIQFPKRKRNLIYIYLESMEVASTAQKYGGNQDDNYIPELTQLALENESFSGSRQTINGGRSLYNSGWTIAALWAHTTGLPLTLPINSTSMELQNSFCPDVTSLGDILLDNGYQNVFMCGSYAVFGGRALLFETHGSYNILDYNSAVTAGIAPQGYYVWWGIEDQKLFDFARKEATALAQSDTPFNLTLLTVDTHFVGGYVCDLCKDEFSLQYNNVMHCSSRQVAEFVHWAQQQSWYENTTIVLVGDHPTMDPDYTDAIADGYERKVYTCFINAAAKPADSIMREYATFDMFPTTLAAIGCTIEGERLGLGTNLFASVSTLTEQYGASYQNEEIPKRSELIETLMQVDEELTYRAEAIRIENGDKGSGYTINVYNVPEDDSLDTVTLGIWQDEKQGDLFWADMQPEGNGIYSAFVADGKLNEVPGIYCISVRLNYESGGSTPFIPELKLNFTG